MSIDYFSSLTYSDISSPFIMENYLRTEKSQSLSKEEIIELIKRFGFTSNLILLHINKQTSNNQKITPREVSELLFAKEKTNIRHILKYFAPAYIIDFCAYVLYEKALTDKNKVKEILPSLLITYFKCIKNDFNHKCLIIFSICQEHKLFDDYDFEVFARIWEVIEPRATDAIRLKLQLTAIVSGINYPVSGNILLAYKGVRDSGQSTMCDFVYYTAGLPYTELTDDDPYTENSFGLSAWSYSAASLYCSEQVIPVYINLADIKFLDIKTGKIRCSSFTVANYASILSQ